MKIRIKKIGTVIETRIDGVRIYGEIIGNTKTSDRGVIYDVKLDNGDIQEFDHYSITSVTKTTQPSYESTRKSIIENPLNSLRDWTSLPLDKWESIISYLPEELKKDLRNIQGTINSTKRLYKLK